jgi:hypothetical protein
MAGCRMSMHENMDGMHDGVQNSVAHAPQMAVTIDWRDLSRHGPINYGKFESRRCHVWNGGSKRYLRLSLVDATEEYPLALHVTKHCHLRRWVYYMHTACGCQQSHCELQKADAAKWRPLSGRPGHCHPQEIANSSKCTARVSALRASRQ